MKKRIMLFPLLLVMVLLCGCGQTNGAGKDMTLSKAIEKYQLWYEIKPDSDYLHGKDSQVKAVYYIQNGSATRYGMSDLDLDYTLGNFAKMSDEEIIDLLENTQKDVNDWEKKAEEDIAYCEQCISSGVFSGDYTYEFDYNYLDDEGYSYLLLQISDDFDFDIFIETSGREHASDKVVVHLDASAVKTEFEDALQQLKNDKNTFENMNTKPTFAIFTDSSGNQPCSEVLRIENGRLHYESGHADLLPGKTNDEQLNQIIKLLMEGWKYGKVVSYNEKEIVCQMRFDTLEELQNCLGGHTDQFHASDALVEVSYACTPFTVYDSQYGGYSFTDAPEDAFVTRVDKNVNFVIDDLHTTGIEIDPVEGFR